MEFVVLQSELTVRVPMPSTVPTNYILFFFNSLTAKLAARAVSAI
jgi:hypothetical protein